MESVIYRSALFGLCAMMTGSLFPLTAGAVDAAYVAAVEADAAEFTTHAYQPPADTSWLGSGSEAGATAGAANPISDLEGFSSFLQSKSPGSYIFYAKLPTEYKERLHQDYLATGDLDRIKADIFKYAREAKR